MTLRLYDTSARSTRDFVPLVPGKVSMYLCGATVQASPHVGHLRSGIVFDVLTRWLRESGYQVTLCRNVTDIDDKILAKAETEQRPWWAVAAHYERAFTAAYEVLGCLPPTVEPRATGHVTQMVELMQRLIDNGYAYAAAGDVYFNVNAFADYGALSNQRPADMLPASDSEHGDRKRDPRDFALWKGAKPGEPSWPTPWGDGRPGWHLECSAMAYAYLGEAFDIHGGGLDLVFPHHENEIAQSRAAGYGFAQYWLHNAWVTASGEKMSKSLGNTMVVSEVVKSIRPIELRWYLVGAHYRSNLEYSEAALQESGAAFRRIEGFLKRATAKSGAVDLASAELPVAFVDAMNDDLGVPAGLAVLHELVTEGNTILNAGSATARLAEIVGMVRRALAVLGVDPMADEWNQVGDTAKWEEVVDALVQAQLAQRNAARAAKDWAASDAIRDGLKAAGISIEDTADGARWSLLED